MFKFLSRRDDNPGFADAVVLTNKSQHWLTLTEEGHRIPPFSHAAIDASSLALSTLIPQHLEAGHLVVSAQPTSNQQPKPKKKKRVEVEELVEEQVEQIEVEPTITPEVSEAPSDTLVAEPEPENWVSSTENIVGLPTTDEI